MMRKFYHNELGHIQVLLEIERCENYIETGKHIALVKCFMVPREDSWNGSFNGFVNKRWTTGKLKPEYYLLWGNDSDLNQRGITRLKTKTGRAVAERTALKRLHEAHKAMEFVTFNRI